MQQMSLFSVLDKGKKFSEICDILGCENNTPAWPDRFGIAIQKWLKENNIPPIRTLSLFSGAGGLDIGFSDVGFDIVDSVEIERKFCDTLELNTGEGRRFNNSKVNCIDIQEFSGKDLGKIDFIIGGPPCQTFSAAGRRANGVLGTTDARGVLFKEYVRLLEEMSPKGFLFENVYGIIGAQGGEPWKEILQAFSDVGYNLFYRIVDAADYGVPQHRERLIIVGLKDGNFKFPRPTHGPDSVDGQPFYNAETAIEGVISTETDESNRLGGRYANLLDDIPPGLNYSFYTEKMGHPNPIFAWRSKFSDFLYKADPNTPVRTIKASGGAYTGPLHWDNRFFNLEEYKRLQTFPDDYQISGSKQIAVKQIGNSVPPQLARMMAIAIRQQVFDTCFPFELSLLEDSEQLTFRTRKRQLTSIYKMKAEKAINALADRKKGLPDSCEYHCQMEPNFNFKEVTADKADFKVIIHWNKQLKVEIHELDEINSVEYTKIKITPRYGSWTLGVEEVNLSIFSKKKLAYTAAWKAFEYELMRNAIKADLVQLNGYYQYTPKLLCRCEISENVIYGDVLKSVVSGENVAVLITTSELAQNWNVQEDEVIKIAEHLKSIGYEIRNNATNPQIEKGSWLIPYAFPTLTQLSVQLWKKLR